MTLKDLEFDIRSLLLSLVDNGFLIGFTHWNDQMRVYIRKSNYRLSEIWDSVQTINDFVSLKFNDISISYFCDQVELDKFKADRNMSNSKDESVDKVFFIDYKIPNKSNDVSEIKRMKFLDSFNIFENKSNIKFIRKEKKKGAKTDTYDVSKGGTVIGQIKWSSRMRGYAFLPTSDCSSEISEFVKDLMRKRREEK